MVRGVFVRLHWQNILSLSETCVARGSWEVICLDPFSEARLKEWVMLWEQAVQYIFFLLPCQYVTLGSTVFFPVTLLNISNKSSSLRANQIESVDYQCFLYDPWKLWPNRLSDLLPELIWVSSQCQKSWGEKQSYSFSSSFGTVFGGNICMKKTEAGFITGNCVCCAVCIPSLPAPCCHTSFYSDLFNIFCHWASQSFPSPFLPKSSAYFWSQKNSNSVQLRMCLLMCSSWWYSLPVALKTEIQRLACGYPFAWEGAQVKM